MKSLLKGKTNELSKMKHFFLRLWAFVMGLVVMLPVLADEPLRIAHGPYLQNVSESEVSVVWVTNKPSTAWLELAPDDETHFYDTKRERLYDVTNGLVRRDSIHVVHIRGLKPGTRYRYRVYAREVVSYDSFRLVYGSYAATNVYSEQPLTFVTNDARKSRVSFAVVNDIHERSEEIPTLFGQLPKKPDMVFFNGDMVSFFRSQRSIFADFMDAAVSTFAKETPLYYARGNHETRGLYPEHFQRYFSPGDRRLYSCFRNGPVCFVVLDSGEDKPDSDIEYNSLADYDRYRTEQAEWLRQVVESPLYKEASFRVVVCHIPPIADEERMWHGQREVLHKFVPLLNASGADLMLCGHLHKYLYNPAGTNEEVGFPVVVNSNTDILMGEADERELLITIRNREGKTVAQHRFVRK